MYRLWGLIRTDFLRRFDGPIAWVFFLLLPFLFTAAVGAGLSGMMDDAPAEEVRVALAVIRRDEGPLVDALLAALADVNFDVEVVDTFPDDAFGLIIPAEFSARLLAAEEVELTLHVRSDSSDTPAVEQAVRAAIGRVGSAALVAQAGVEQARTAGLVTTPEEEAAFFSGLLLDTLAAVENPAAVTQIVWPAGVTLETDTQNMANSAEHASAGQIVTWVQITLLGAAEVLVDERLRGTLRRMLIMPTSRALILGGKVLATVLAGLLQIAILLVGGAVVFHVGWDKAPLAVAAISVAFALAIAGMGLLLATCVKTGGQASSAVVGLSLIMAAVGGAWFPLEITPPLYRQIVQILPSTWAMQAYEDILARGATLGDVLPAVGVLLGFAIVFTVIGVWRFNHYE
ncbi:MAG TPA: ABC transporter permease [Anaerolineae bacterium]|nr:ABC transporter permease [Anaerolineae bacterium]HQH38465.1 ABC transporter permease [Anaerolineae bacterium]